MKTKFLMLALFVGLLSFSSVAKAEDVDFGKLTCKYFNSSSDQEKGILLMWIDGYMSALAENTVMSDEWMKKLGMHFGSYCAANPGKTMMETMEAMPED